MKDYEGTLAVNGENIELINFPLEYVTKTIAGAVSSLKKVAEVNELELTLNHGKVKLTVNGANIPLIPFPNLILASTLKGIAAPLKGVNGEVVSLHLKMKTAA